MRKEDVQDEDTPPFAAGDFVAPDPQWSSADVWNSECYRVVRVSWSSRVEMWKVEVVPRGVKEDKGTLEYWAWRFVPYKPPYDEDLANAVTLLTRYRAFILSAKEDELCSVTIGRLSARAGSPEPSPDAGDRVQVRMKLRI